MGTIVAFVLGMMFGGAVGIIMAAVLMASREDTMNHGLKVNNNVLEITLPDGIEIQKVVVNGQTFGERDMPMKPNETTDHTWGIPWRQAVCPNCDYYLGKISFIGEGAKNMVTYCEHCGQAIDWSEWEEGEQK